MSPATRPVPLPANYRAPQVCAIDNAPNVPLAEFAAKAQGPFSCCLGWFGAATVRPEGLTYHRPLTIRLVVGRILSRDLDAETAADTARINATPYRPAPRVLSNAERRLYG